MNIPVHLLDVYPEQMMMVDKILRKCPDPKLLDRLVSRDRERYYISRSAISNYKSLHGSDPTTRFCDRLKILDTELVSLVLKSNRLMVEEERESERVFLIKKCLTFFDIPLSIYEKHYKI